MGNTSADRETLFRVKTFLRNPKLTVIDKTHIVVVIFLHNLWGLQHSNNRAIGQRFLQMMTKRILSGIVIEHSAEECYAVLIRRALARNSCSSFEQLALFPLPVLNFKWTTANTCRKRTHCLQVSLMVPVFKCVALYCIFTWAWLCASLI